jgi:hypothetical protein
VAITWTEHATPGTGGNFGPSDAIWADALGLFVLVGENTSSLAGLIYTSPDGVTWTVRTSPQMNRFRGVTWSPSLNLLCAVSINGTNRIQTSPDGVTWTVRTAPAVAGWRAVTWAPALNLFVAVGATAVAAWSPDGVTWTSGTGVPATRGWQGVTWAPSLGLFVATSGDTTGLTTDRIMTSADGKAWTGRTHPAAQFGPGTVFGGNSNCAWSPTLGLFVAAAKTPGGGPFYLVTSPDGVTWTVRTLPTGTGVATTFFGGVWDTVGHRFVNGANASGFPSQYQWESTDGVTWTPVNPDPGGVFNWGNSYANVLAFSPTLSRFVWVNSGADVIATGVAPAGGLSPSTGLGGGGALVTFTHQ